MTETLIVQRVRPGQVPAYVASLRGAYPVATELHAFHPEFGRLDRVHLFAEGALRPAASAAMEAMHAEPPTVMALDRRHGRFTIEPDDRIFELRTYTPAAGAAADFLAAMLDALAVREKFSRTLGVWRSSSHGAERILHLWPYRDLAHRDEARRGVGATRQWQEYGRYAFSVLAEMESTLLVSDAIATKPPG